MAKTGYLVGRPPYGFRIVGVVCGESPCRCEDDHKTLESDPVTSEIVRQMVDMYLAGSTRRDVALWLDAREVPVPNRKKGRQTGQTWTGHGVMVILHSETLVGQRKRFLKLRQDAKPGLQRSETGETVAERWLRLTDLERRDYLLRAKAKIYAAGKSPADGWRLVVEEPNVLAA